jgi:hypothetical protein
LAGTSVSLDDIPDGPAQRALVRISRMALSEDDKSRRAIRDALQSAGRGQLPTEPVELLGFVRAHLAPRLSDAVE